MKSPLLVEALKKELKSRSITYAQLGKRVGLTEAAIKRAFAARNFSLKRLDQFCEAIELDLAQLFESLKQAPIQTPYFAPQVEAALAKDPELLLTLYLLLMRYPYKNLPAKLRISEAKLFKLVLSLEKLGLVEVLPHHRIKTKIKKSTRWLPGGPLAKKYAGFIREEFFNTDFSAPNQAQDFLTGPLTLGSFKTIRQKQVELFRLFEELSTLDARLKDEQTEVYWLYTGIRPWAPLPVISRSIGKNG